MKGMRYTNGQPQRKNGRFVYIEEKECCAQRLIHSLKIWKNEWFLNTSESIDWLSLMQDKPASDRRIRKEVTTILLSDEEVSLVESIDISYDAEHRKIAVAFVVQTLVGTVGGSI